MTERTVRNLALQASGRSEMEALVLQEIVNTKDPGSVNWTEIMAIMTEKRYDHESVFACHDACAAYSPYFYGSFAKIVLDHCFERYAERSFDPFCQLSILALFRAGCNIQRKRRRNIENDFIRN